MATNRLSFSLRGQEFEDWEELSHAETLQEFSGVLQEIKQHEQKDFHLWKEFRSLVNLALPSVLIQFSLFWIFLMAASVVGRTVGTVALGGFSLGALVANLTCLSIMEGALTAADTLMPRSFSSKDYPEVARLAIRGAITCTIMLTIVVVPLCTVAGDILHALGQDRDASELAEEWIRYYFIGAPANLGFRVIMRFLMAQQQPWLMVYAAVIPCLFVHPILLWYFVPRMGCAGSALAISITLWCCILLLVALVYCFPVHHPSTWPGFSRKLLREALRPKPLGEFLHLSFGGIVSMNEWWFFEVCCFIAGSIGVEALCAHTIAYNLVPLLFMYPLGLSISLCIRVGHVIVFDADKAIKIASWCMVLMVLSALVVCSVLYGVRLEAITAFTQDPEVIALADEIWIYLCFYIFLLYIFGMNHGILRALGMQWRLATTVGVVLWIFSLPSVVYFALCRQGGLIAMWRVLPFWHTVLQISLSWSFISLDWHEHSVKIRNYLQTSVTRRNSAVPGSIPVETTSLL